ncbi:hypothetical protein [Labedaea rhizosphaerae]|uniref:Thioesterase domain-containing protein n=1 Tax=Labedaea rhizosphaerae TaxID=598644 RepID=A0A4V3CY71_LABRH|nr:hypothetical protein [Labedaea rhizosphaerae]TDP92978.1 hypothetical protein EV186_107213 [Labedaea rhizosphaerae]
MKLTNWRQLSGRGPDLVLCLDFPGGRAAAGFADLAAGVDAGASFLHIGQSVAGGLDECVHRWVAEVTATGRPVRAVLGYCAGAALAPCVADAIADAADDAPAVVLFDAVATTADSLAAQLPAALEASAAHLSADELDDARLLADELAQTYPDDLPAIVAAVTKHYDALMGTLATRLGLNEFFHRELTKGFTTYLDYLLLASAGRFGTRHGTPTIVSSADHEPPEADGEHIVLDVAHTDLLRDASVHQLVTTLLTGERTW